MINGLDLDCGTQKIGFQSKILLWSKLPFLVYSGTVAPPFFGYMDFHNPKGRGRKAEIIVYADF